MKERWSDEELDLGLRDLFFQANKPVAPPTLRIFPRNVVGATWPSKLGGLSLHPRIPKVVAVAATLAIALAVGMAALIVSPAAMWAPRPNPSSSPSASVSNMLPARLSSGGFVWTRLSLPTHKWWVPGYAWDFSKAGGLMFGADCIASVPGEIWISTDALNWTHGGVLPGTGAGDRICPSDVVWDGSRYVASGTIAHGGRAGCGASGGLDFHRRPDLDEDRPSGGSPSEALGCRLRKGFVYRGDRRRAVAFDRPHELEQGPGPAIRVDASGPATLRPVRWRGLRRSGSPLDGRFVRLLLQRRPDVEACRPGDRS